MEFNDSMFRSSFAVDTLRVSSFQSFLVMRKPIHLAGAAAAAASVFGSSIEANAFSVGGYKTPEDLVTALLIPGWSPVAGSITITEAAGPGNGSVGFFNNGGSSIGINSGVILTSGYISNAPGPNNTSSATGPGQLSRISFDFVAVSPGISWNYAFASEEYEEYVGSSFNDFFRLELNGKNLALIPGTNTDVRINNVNQLSNSSFYVSNYPPGAAAPYDIQYDGFTIPLTAKATGLTLGSTYNVSFTVSDVGDSAFDSAVMIAANSVSFPGGSPDNPLLPVPPANTNSTWVFPAFTVFDPGFVWWIDPEIATGYVYNVTGGPLFDQFTAPDLPFNDTYQLFSSSLPGGACSTNGADFATPLGMGLVTQQIPYDFPTPLPCFAIKGISIENALDPLNTSAFLAGVSFDATGTANVTQTPINTFGPSDVPGPLPILGAGAAFGWAKRLRSRVSRRSGSCRSAG
ncbi:MAG: choice-of-anchor L domain-containing protein [Synechococcaceae cyanobacterium]|nr:choice-of-anchor L domain-containing protein [Synechococcaceae cyanobacterium]